MTRKFMRPCAVMVLGFAWLAAPAGAGEWTVAYRLGATNVNVDGDRLSTGTNLSDHGLLHHGLAATYRWPAGPVVEGVLSNASDALPLFDDVDLHHYSLGVGWQFDLGQWWRFTPKAGMVYSELDATQEDIFEGGEPRDHLQDVVPYAEVMLEDRIRGRFGIGMYFRKNFEDYGRSRMVGISLGWTFR